MDSHAKVVQMGLDCHRKFSRMTGRDAKGKVVVRERLDHGNRLALHRQLSRWPQGTPVVLEGSFGWGWLSDELQSAGLAPHLCSTGKVAAWRKARGMAKSNRTDADLLSELWDQKPHWWEVWLAPQATRDQREWLRYRMNLVQIQTATKNRIHATLHRHGILHDFSDLFGKRGRQFLEQLTAHDDGTLRSSGRLTLKGHCQLLEQVRGQIAQVTRELRRQVRRSEEGERWRSLPGIAWVLAYTIMAEVGTVDRFKNGKHLASYSLLVPRADDSGDEDDEVPIGRHVGHAGRRTLKWAFIEAAHGAVLKSARFRAIFDRRTNGGKRDRNRGYIAVAHELCRVGFSCVKNARDYTEDRPPRPGRGGLEASS